MGNEYYLNVAFVLKNDTYYADKGFEIANEQLSLGANDNENVSRQPVHFDALTIHEGDTVTISGNKISIKIDSKTGSVFSYEFRGCQVISEPVMPCFWRVPTDNDEGGGNSGFASRWRSAGLDNYTTKVESFSINPGQDGSVAMNVKSTLTFRGERTMTSDIVYKFSPDGSISFDINLNVTSDFPPLARVGMQFAMPSYYKYIKWYGRGPFESYQDRKVSADVGIYSGAVADQHFPYVMPQETGNKTDVRWLKIMDEAQTGLMIAGDQLLEMNVQDYSQKALNESKTSHSLLRGDKTYVHVDLKQMGLGGDDSWSPRVHEEYQLKAKNYHFGFSIDPF